MARWRTDATELRGDMDDAAAALCDHQRQHSTAHQICTGDVYGEHAVPVGRRDSSTLPFGSSVAAPLTRTSDWAEFRVRRRDCGAGVRFRGDVAAEGSRTPAGGDDCLGCHFRRCEIEIEAGDGAAACREGDRDGPANATAGPGDDRGFTAQRLHSRFFSPDQSSAALRPR
jgi:hypothetical protein